MIFKLFSIANVNKLLNAIIVFPVPFGAKSKIFFLDFAEFSISLMIYS
jgi:hypothetical protein